MADVRWFGLNDYEHLIVADLRRLGLDVVTAGDERATLTVDMSHDLAPSAWRYARRHDSKLISYIWDLPPFRLGAGEADYVVPIGGHLLTLPRIRRRYSTRRGYYSRLRYVATHAAEVWTPSRVSASDVRQRFRVPAVPVAYCYDSRLFTNDRPESPARADQASDRLTLLSVSRLTPPKNHAAVLRAAARINARVEFVGRGPTQSSLEALARELNVPCQFRSGLPGLELKAAYQRASVVVCPSRFEGLGLTGIEAAMCGTPVAASDIPAHREFLGSAAHLFILDDDASLADSIRQANNSKAPLAHQFQYLTIESAASRFYDRLKGSL